MDDVGEWCRKHLSGAAVEVHSSGPEGITVSLPYELQSINAILQALTDAHDVDIDYRSTETGGELKIYSDYGTRPAPRAEEVARPSLWAQLWPHVVWGLICFVMLRMQWATERSAGPFNTSAEL